MTGRIMHKDIARIIDANCNRSREGLRVCEEVARFTLRSPALAQACKSSRDSMTRLIRRLERSCGPLERARDTSADIGRASRIPGSVTRKSIRDVFAANIQRVKESLRVLEEFSKVVDPAVARSLSELRFASYDIEKKALQRIDGLRYR